MLNALSTFVACLHPTARLIGLVILIVGAAHVIASSRRARRFRGKVSMAWIAVLAAALWLGSLQYSPLQFGSGRLPVLGAFEIRRPNRAPVTISPGAVISAPAGLPLVIHPEMMPLPVDCRWSSSAGGALDDPRSCDTAYVPPQGMAFDTLRLRVQPACGLPPVLAQIKISILP